MPGLAKSTLTCPFIKAGNEEYAMKILTLYFLLLLGTFISTPLLAMDLVQIYNLASERDAELKIALSQLQVSRQALPLAQSPNRPQVNLSANATYQDKGNTLTR